MTFVIIWPGGKKIIYAKNHYHLHKILLNDRWIRKSFINKECEITNITHKPVKQFELEYDYIDNRGPKQIEGHEIEIVKARHWFEAINDFYDRKHPQIGIPNSVKWREL